MSESDIEPGLLPWRKSTFSGANGCVEVAQFGQGQVALRDSKNPELGFFVYDAHEWKAFLLGVRNGEFDQPV